MISDKVMKIDEFKDSVFYKVACDCGEDEHTLAIEFEYDKEIPEMIFLNFYKKIAWSSYWGDSNIFKKGWNRIKAATRILFTGYIDLEESFIIRGEKHVDSFIEALEEGKKYMKGE